MNFAEIYNKSVAPKTEELHPAAEVLLEDSGTVNDWLSDPRTIRFLAAVRNNLASTRQASQALLGRENTNNELRHFLSMTLAYERVIELATTKLLIKQDKTDAQISK